MAESTEERWLPVVGYEGLYEVSDMGRVRSLIRSDPHILRPSFAGRGGYPRVMLAGNKCMAVHVIVAAAFIGQRPDGADVRHKNGDRRDSRAENLEYGTRSQNIADCYRHGTAKAQLSECVRGHVYDAENTGIVWSPDGTVKSRFCRTCRKVVLRRYEQKRKAKAR